MWIRGVHSFLRPLTPDFPRDIAHASSRPSVTPIFLEDLDHAQRLLRGWAVSPAAAPDVQLLDDRVQLGVRVLGRLGSGSRR